MRVLQVSLCSRSGLASRVSVEKNAMPEMCASKTRVCVCVSYYTHALYSEPYGAPGVSGDISVLSSSRLRRDFNFFLAIPSPPLVALDFFRRRIVGPPSCSKSTAACGGAERRSRRDATRATSVANAKAAPPAIRHGKANCASGGGGGAGIGVGGGGGGFGMDRTSKSAKST